MGECVRVVMLIVCIWRSGLVVQGMVAVVVIGKEVCIGYLVMLEP